MLDVLEWLWKAAAWFVLSVLAPFVVPIGLLLADQDGRLPVWLRWFETPDDLGWDAGKGQLPDIANTYLRLWVWLGLRNRALGFQWAAGHPWPQRIPEDAGFKTSGPFWRFDAYGRLYFGAGWKTHGPSEDPATWLAVPFITVRVKP